VSGKALGQQRDHGPTAPTGSAQAGDAIPRYWRSTTAGAGTARRGHDSIRARWSLINPAAAQTACAAAGTLDSGTREDSAATLIAARTSWLGARTEAAIPSTS
jgi:hypothetical protein